MDERIAAMINGYAAVLIEVLEGAGGQARAEQRLMFERQRRSVLLRRIERSEPAGFDEILMRILISIEGWADISDEQALEHCVVANSGMAGWLSLAAHKKGPLVAVLFHFR